MSHLEAVEIIRSAANHINLGHPEKAESILMAALWEEQNELEKYWAWCEQREQQLAGGPLVIEAWNQSEPEQRVH